MPRITFQKPTDQPSGRNRLLESLRQALGAKEFADFRLMVAFAKAGPLYRLESALKSWLAGGKAIHAIIGVDEKGTSKEALEFALAYFTETHIAHVAGPFTSLCATHRRVNPAKSSRAFTAPNRVPFGWF
jgi:hypothetical protein